MYVQVPFFGFRRKFYAAQTNSFTASESHKRNPQFHALSDTCFSDLIFFVISLPFQVGSWNLTTTFETVADLESIDGEANKREDI